MKQNQIASETQVKTFAVGDMKVRVSGKGYPLVLLHGFTITSEFWREQAEEFSAPLAGWPCLYDETVTGKINSERELRYYHFGGIVIPFGYQREYSYVRYAIL